MFAVAVPVKDINRMTEQFRAECLDTLRVCCVLFEDGKEDKVS